MRRGLGALAPYHVRNAQHPPPRIVPSALTAERNRCRAPRRLELNATTLESRVTGATPLRFRRCSMPFPLLCVINLRAADPPGYSPRETVLRGRHAKLAWRVGLLQSMLRHGSQRCATLLRGARLKAGERGMAPNGPATAQYSTTQRGTQGTWRKPYCTKSTPACAIPLRHECRCGVGLGL